MSRVSASASLADLHQAGPVAEHRDAHDPQLALAGVVVEQGDGQVVAVGVAQQGGDDLGRPLAGAEDEQPVAAVAVGPALALDRQPPAVADAGHQHQGDEPADERDAEGEEPGFEQRVKPNRKSE